MARTAKLIYTAGALAVFWIILTVILWWLRQSMPAYPRWLDLVLASAMLISAVFLALRMVLTKRVNLGASFLIGTIVLLATVVAFGAKEGGVLRWLRDGLALVTVLVLLLQYARARRNRESKDIS